MLLRLSVPTLRSQGVCKHNLGQFIQQLLDGGAEQPIRGSDFRIAALPRMCLELQPSTDVELRGVGREEFMHVASSRIREPPLAHEAKG
jgi:hypothetical protein